MTEEKKAPLMRLTNPVVREELEKFRDDLHKLIGCKRRPGVQVAIDALVQFWNGADGAAIEHFMPRWKTPVVGYPHSTRKNPGQFASKEELDG